jgi:hypothetical protein
MLSSILADTRTDPAGASATTNRPAQSASDGSSFADILVSTTSGGTPDGRATEKAIAAAASAAANDVDILAKLSGAFRNSAPNGALGVSTIDRSGNVIADASLDASGNLSVFASGSSGDASSTIGMSLSSQSSDGGSWYANASAELAQASYELNSLISQSTAAAGVDRAA